MNNDFSNDFVMRAEDGERRKRARAHKIATVEIPLLRLLGSAFLSLGVYLNNRFLLQTASNAG